MGLLGFESFEVFVANLAEVIEGLVEFGGGTAFADALHADLGGDVDVDVEVGTAEAGAHGIGLDDPVHGHVDAVVSVG